MLAVLLLATLIVAFIAGIVALAMPCCFTVLLPSYMAKSFDTISGRVGMTALFGVGIATVLLPIAMGAWELTTFLSANHTLLFVIGGFFMIVLGLLTLWGVPILPMSTGRSVDLQRKDAPSVYVLGVFSGVASSCCAPVLAGVLVLTVLSGSWLPALLVGLAYVAGMVFPLLVISVLWDRRANRVAGLLRGRMVSFRFLGSDVDIHSSKLVAGTLFILIGVVTVGLGLVDRMLLVPGSSLFGIYETALERALLAAFGDPRVIALAITFLTIAIISTTILLIRRRGRARVNLDDGETGGEPVRADDSASTDVSTGHPTPTEIPVGPSAGSSRERGT